LNNVKLLRTANDSVEISWESFEDSRTLSIYKGESPKALNYHTSVTCVKGKTLVQISGLNPDVRYYFELVPDQGSGVIVSERRVPLEGSVNFRDLGGYRTLDGRRLRWGQVFRSDNLGRLTDRDIKILRRMGIRQVCDFRTPAEVKKMPDRFPETNEGAYVHLPIKYGEYDPANTFERIKNGDVDWLTEEFMIKGYLRNVDRFTALWSTFFRIMVVSRNRPLVFHCTGGKDRAGVCAALILLTLGVAEETVIEDHGLSNIYIADVLKRIYAQIKSYGVDPAKVAPYFTAPRSAIIALVEHIRKTYGSAEDYLINQAGIEVKVINQLREDLLE
jgi:protein-tyrosine phosphatase